MVDGSRLVAGPSEPLLSLFREVWIDDTYRPARFLASPSTTVVDIGANVGVFAVWAARRLGASRVVAVEPNPMSARALRVNLATNRIPGASVEEAAVAREEGSATLYRRSAGNDRCTLYQQDAYGSDFEPVGTVRTVTLDGVFRTHEVGTCDVLKLDCEGAEYDILAATSAPVFARIRHIVAEWHVGLNGHQPDELRDLLRAHGFDVVRFTTTDIEGGMLHASRSAV
jgi:FkbM family methyltransferase